MIHNNINRIKKSVAANNDLEYKFLNISNSSNLNFGIIVFRRNATNLMQISLAR